MRSSYQVGKTDPIYLFKVCTYLRQLMWSGFQNFDPKKFLHPLVTKTNCERFQGLKSAIFDPMILIGFTVVFNDSYPLLVLSELIDG